MWDPGFEYCDKQIARLSGYQRSFCMRSIHYRGTVAQPGLVLALDISSGDYCDGLAFRVAGENVDQVQQYLRDRELISAAYLETRQPITLRCGEQVLAVTYVIDADHEQYCGGLALQEQAEIIATATGARGPNIEYLHSTAAHLHALNIADADLDWLSDRVKAIV
jgi:cation transport protein ChaC